VIAERDHVRAGLEQPRRELRRDPDAVGDVLAVDDAEADAELLPQAGEALRDRAAARRPDNIANEQKFQRTEGTAAGRTDSETLLPLSCV
jgi:hypothetical protein